MAIGGADFEHFTWWSLASFAVYSQLAVAGYDAPFFWLFQCLQLQVVFAVLLMAFVDCDVFETAFDENGALVYIVGNFGMHYLPSVVVYALSTRRHMMCGVTSAVFQVWTSYAVYLVWFWFEDPWETYGCSLPASLGLFGSFSLKLICTIGVLTLQAQTITTVTDLLFGGD